MTALEPFSAHVQRGKVLRYFFFAAVFAGIGLWLIGEPGVANGRRGFGASKAFWGWVCLLFFGLCAAVFLRLLLMSGPSLLATAEGVTLRWMSGRPYGPIPWAHIELCEMPTTAAGQTVLRIHLIDPKETQDLLGKRPTLFGQSNLKKLVEMPGIQLNKDPKDLKAAFVAFYTHAGTFD